MQMHLALHAQGRKSTPYVHFAQVIGAIGEILGENGIPAPASFQDPDTFAASYLSYNLCRKAKNLYGLDEDPKARSKRTLDGFLEREFVNKLINNQRTWGYSSYTGEFSSDLLGEQLLHRARELLHTIIGQKPNIDRIVRNSSFGNGASATMKRTESQGPNKFLYGRSVTTRLRSFIAHAIRTSSAWSELSDSDPVVYVDSTGRHTLSDRRLACVAGAVLDQVDKTATINRIILKEPELNGFIQSGIGREIRQLLRCPLHNTDGVDLNFSGEVNAELARYGSETGRVATVDGERASDSLTIALFEFFFPPEWFELMFMARSPYCVIDGRLHRLEMMGGMGNGFTFEAESLIFYCMGLACAERSKLPFAERVVSIHGDDLIVPADVKDEVLLVFETAGVVVNVEKSFFDGPFRESCGGHYWMGHDVKPFYLKKQDGRSRGDWFWLSNSLLLWLNARSEDYRQSVQGKALVALLKYLNWYSASGRPLEWRAPVDSSRRAGLYSDPPMLRGGSWKTRMVCVRQDTERLPDDGLYLEWLNAPKVVTVYDLLFPKRKPMDRADTQISVYELDQFRRLTVWNGFSDCGLVTPLWWLTALKSKI